ncbi:hypothetical protein D3C73_1223940 [compost metagenome]
MVDVVAELGVVEVIELGKPGKRNAADRYPQAAHRVPNADKVQVGIAREVRAKRERFDGRRMAIVTVKRVGFGDMLVGGAFEQAAFADHAGQAARRVRATAETEQEDVVAGFLALA